MAIPDRNEDDRQRADRVIAEHMADIRREIGALRREILEEGQSVSDANDSAGYRIATQIDLMVNKFLRSKSARTVD